VIRARKRIEIEKLSQTQIYTAFSDTDLPCEITNLLLKGQAISRGERRFTRLF